MSEIPVVCLAKHTRPQIPDADWRCSKCGATADDSKGFYIEETDESASENCALLHERDGITCWNCRTYTTGKKLAAAYAKQKALVTCPTCKGEGYVNTKQTEGGAS